MERVGGGSPRQIGQSFTGLLYVLLQGGLRHFRLYHDLCTGFMVVSVQAKEANCSKQFSRCGSCKDQPAARAPVRPVVQNCPDDSLGKSVGRRRVRDV